jgi:hypothetical protein
MYYFRGSIWRETGFYKNTVPPKLISNLCAMSHSDGRNFFTFEGAGFNAKSMPAKSSVVSSRDAVEPFNVS